MLFDSVKISRLKTSRDARHLKMIGLTERTQDSAEHDLVGIAAVHRRL